MPNSQTTPQNPQQTPITGLRVKNPAGADVCQVEMPGEGIVWRLNQFQSPVYTGVGAPTTDVPKSPCNGALYLATDTGNIYLFSTTWTQIGTLPTVPLPQNTPAVVHEFITAYNSSTGAFTQAQPAASDVSGLAPSATTDTTNASNITSGTLPAGRLPAPTPTTLGGVESKATTTHQFLTQIGTDGSVSAAQPAAADVSGLAASATTDTTNASNITTGTLPAAQLPNPSASTLGGVKSLAAVSHNFLTSIGTNGTPTQAQPAASDLSNGVTGSGVVVLATSPSLTTPNIGAATCTSLAGAGNQKQIFTSSGTFTIPAGVTQAKVTVTGAGGAGGGGTSGATGNGGGAGGTAIKWLTGLTPGNTIAVTVGTGGGGTSGGAGATGGNSSIASGTQTITTVTGNGGTGGSNTAGSIGGGGSATNGDINAAGGWAVWAVPASGFGGQGGNGFFGGSGTGAFSNGGGTGGGAPGAGGGGGGGNVSNTTGGAGANGIVIFEWIS